jgi:hypothetical protein
LRLLLDEHYSSLIAEQLRGGGHDVFAVAERPDLVGVDDAALLALMASERRAILTENSGDFQRELRIAATTGSTHYGVVFTSRKQLPRARVTIGLYVRVLDEFLRRHPADDALLDSYVWLPDRPVPVNGD